MMKVISGKERMMNSLIVTLLLLCLAPGMFSGCAKGEKQPNRTGSIMGKSLSETIADHQQHLLSLAGVHRVEPGMCGRDSCIKVYVEKKTPMLEAQIPLMLETWQVDVVESWH